MMRSEGRQSHVLWAVVGVPIVVWASVLPLTLTPIPWLLLWFMLCDTQCGYRPSVAVLVALSSVVDVVLGVPLGAHGAVVLPSCWLYRTLLQKRLPGLLCAGVASALFLLGYSVLVWWWSWPAWGWDAAWVWLGVVLFGGVLRQRV